MTTLPNPPIIEAIFELRWGAPKDNSQNLLIFSENENQFFIGQFKSTVADNGFGVVERVNKFAPTLLPHSISFRFRKEKSSWPCYQIGQGIFTANQAKENYDWKPFKKSIIDGLELLDKGHPDGISNLNPIGVELKYLDAYVHDNQKDPIEFLSESFNIDLKALINESFLEDQYFKKEPKGLNIAFNLETVNPKGIFIFNINQGIINGEPGFLAEIISRSTDKDMPSLDKENISNWLEKSHDLQRHAFNTLVNKAFAKGFNK
jgi:uncharacterized protein (TIGR04255 family)